MPRRRQDVEKDLTDAQRRELMGGDPWTFGRLYDAERSAFDSREAKRAAWEAHHGEIVEEFARQHPGTRPVAWWEWSAPEDAPPYADLVDDRQAQAEYLAAHGLLFTHEQEILEAEDG